MNYKICSNLISSGLRICGSASQIAARNFHIMTKPNLQPQISALPSSVMQPQLTGSYIQRFLAPINTIISQVAGFKVKGRLKRRCKDCYFVIRDRRHYVICPTHPRHKQMSMKKRDYKTWILTDATQSKVRPF
ncbi:39S ribosomal protein L36, mitochondrial [Eupeodes corollae]|uniref:39S ribosomal protein L36, mitochondrial n=1 Tax=Eupeodes corollae TaxID=290404 RepID=UPI0024913A54|nr:39S ribosomal protein L36, mitochondrial [Eupeodes corollae]